MDRTCRHARKYVIHKLGKVLKHLFLCCFHRNFGVLRNQFRYMTQLLRFFTPRKRRKLPMIRNLITMSLMKSFSDKDFNAKDPYLHIIFLVNARRRTDPQARFY